MSLESLSVSETNESGDFATFDVLSSQCIPRVVTFVQCRLSSIKEGHSNCFFSNNWGIEDWAQTTSSMKALWDRSTTVDWRELDSLVSRANGPVVRNEISHSCCRIQESIEFFVMCALSSLESPESQQECTEALKTWLQGAKASNNAIKSEQMTFSGQKKHQRIDMEVRYV